MTRLYSNNFSTTLNGSITDVATSMTLTSVTRFPAVGSGDTCQVTIDDGTNIEIVQATAIAGSVITIVRGQEGTSGVAFADDVKVELRLTTLALTDVLGADTTPQLGGDLDLNGNQITSPDGTDLIDIPNGSIDLQTASTSRVDITDSGLRLGAANSRVTTILDEDAMGSDSATALATQQSIKAYVDEQHPPTAFHAYRNAAQSISNATFTKVNLDTEVFDSGNLFDNTTNYRYTPDVAGTYLFTTAVLFVSGVDGMRTVLAVYKNGSAVMETIQSQGAAHNAGATGCCVIEMNGSTDYVEMYVFQDSGSSKNVQAGASGKRYTFLSGCLVG